jgi:hypothetical protein
MNEQQFDVLCLQIAQALVDALGGFLFTGNAVFCI